MIGHLSTSDYRNQIRQSKTFEVCSWGLPQLIFSTALVKRRMAETAKKLFFDSFRNRRKEPLHQHRQFGYASFLRCCREQQCHHLQSCHDGWDMIRKSRYDGCRPPFRGFHFRRCDHLLLNLFLPWCWPRWWCVIRSSICTRVISWEDHVIAVRMLCIAVLDRVEKKNFWCNNCSVI